MTETTAAVPRQTKKKKREFVASHVMCYSTFIPGETIPISVGLPIVKNYLDYLPAVATAVLRRIADEKYLSKDNIIRVLRVAPQSSGLTASLTITSEALCYKQKDGTLVSPLTDGSYKSAGSMTESQSAFTNSNLTSATITKLNESITHISKRVWSTKAADLVQKKPRIELKVYNA